jgi:hypothetical protein
MSAGGRCQSRLPDREILHGIGRGTTKPPIPPNTGRSADGDPVGVRPRRRTVGVPRGVRSLRATARPPGHPLRGPQHLQRIAAQAPADSSTPTRRAHWLVCHPWGERPCLSERRPALRPTIAGRTARQCSAPRHRPSVVAVLVHHQVADLTLHLTYAVPRDLGVVAFWRDSAASVRSTTARSRTCR